VTGGMIYLNSASRIDISLFGKGVSWYHVCTTAQLVRSWCIGYKPTI